MPHLVIVGGSDAGVSAALRAREVAPEWEVTVIAADSLPNYSVCGLPFYLSGEVPDRWSLAHRTVEDLERSGLHLLLDHTVEGLDLRDGSVVATSPRGSERALSYDRLVIAAGAAPVRPPIPGVDLDGVYFLHTPADAFELHDELETAAPRSAVVVGSGYIGMEMADALTLRGLRVTLVGRAPSVLPTLDPELGQVLASELESHGVEVLSGVAVEAIEREGGRLHARGGDLTRSADLVLVAAGVRPRADLAAAAGLALGVRGAIWVDRHMATKVPGVYAAGDCVETWHRLLERPTYLPLGTTAHKQGRVAGDNAVGGERAFGGSVGTQVVKVFELVAARTGLRDQEARDAGFDPITTETTTWDHTPYYPDPHRLHVRVTGDRKTGRLLGAQIVGPWRAEVAKRIDVFATALYSGLSVDELSDLDLSYTPPVGRPWDAVQDAAQVWGWRPVG